MASEICSIVFYRFSHLSLEFLGLVPHMGTDFCRVGLPFVALLSNQKSYLFGNFTTKFSTVGRVQTGFGKLFKFKMLFSRTWNVWKGEIFQNGYEQVLDFCLEKF